MHIEKLTLREFKRFRELTIDLSGAQPPPRLVLLIGANGSGKSSVSRIARAPQRGNTLRCIAKGRNQFSTAAARPARCHN